MADTLLSLLGVSAADQARGISEANRQADARWEEQQRPAARLQTVYDFDQMIGELYDEGALDKPTWEAAHRLVNAIERTLNR